MVVGGWRVERREIIEGEYRRRGEERREEERRGEEGRTRDTHTQTEKEKEKERARPRAGAAWAVQQVYYLASKRQHESMKPICDTLLRDTSIGARLHGLCAALCMPWPPVHQRPCSAHALHHTANLASPASLVVAVAEAVAELEARRVSASHSHSRLYCCSHLVLCVVGRGAVTCTHGAYPILLGFYLPTHVPSIMHSYPPTPCTCHRILITCTYHHPIHLTSPPMAGPPSVRLSVCPSAWGYAHVNHKCRLVASWPWF